MKPIIKWPGGKSSEIKNIKDLIPSFDRYIEPFFGGGALFFYLKPQNAIINDISNTLIDFYKLVKVQDENLHELLLDYYDSFQGLLSTCNKYKKEILNVYQKACLPLSTKEIVISEVKKLVKSMQSEIILDFSKKLVLDVNEFLNFIISNLADKIIRTVKLNEKRKLSKPDLIDNLYTGFTSGYYMYFRKVYNDINLYRLDNVSLEYKVANFYFIREYCYGSMFRYNQQGEFNIPYGGISYNKKVFKHKIDNMFNQDIKNLFANTKIKCMDFEKLLMNVNLNERDFIFLDPPYDTDFSDYENRAFSKYDQQRLADILKNIKAKFILVIKNTDFIASLYKQNFNIISFDNKYTYNVRGRNERKVEHLIITNFTINNDINLYNQLYIK